MKGNQTQSLFWKPGIVDICLLALLGSRLTPIYVHKSLPLVFDKEKSRAVSHLAAYSLPALSQRGCWTEPWMFCCFPCLGADICSDQQKPCCSNLHSWFIEAKYLVRPVGNQEALCWMANLDHPGDLGDGSRGKFCSHCKEDGNNLGVWKELR